MTPDLDLCVQCGKPISTHLDKRNRFVSCSSSSRLTGHELHQLQTARELLARGQQRKGALSQELRQAVIAEARKGGAVVIDLFANQTLIKRAGICYTLFTCGHVFRSDEAYDTCTLCVSDPSHYYVTQLLDALHAEQSAATVHTTVSQHFCVSLSENTESVR